MKHLVSDQYSTVWDGNIADNYYGHVLEELRSLNPAIEGVRQRIVTVNGVSYASQDARQVALEAIQCDIGACGNWIRTLISLRGLCQEKYGGNREEEYRKLIWTGLSTDQAEARMVNYLRNTITTKVHFTIENLFSNILKALSASPAGSGFWSIKNAMLTQADIPLKGPEDDTLMVLAKLRNSFHKNGMSDRYPLSCVVGGLQFEFSEGKPIKCASDRKSVV